MPTSRKKKPAKKTKDPILALKHREADAAIYFLDPTQGPMVYHTGAPSVQPVIMSGWNAGPVKAQRRQNWLSRFFRWLADVLDAVVIGPQGDDY